ncbi:hypothetical protein [Capillimicrobium parvum]|uniref:Uncharacterized protein n=1 Tax=Capillimicrobium parvum TaxID=2884022 RepID=A0A9E6XY79_9ACTN|nr:hypothetical protein [Capillimicrobium parvum]UGS36037.1 hypothetical protein DSM104329_02434 [Capillimicrobium parvum]
MPTDDPNAHFASAHIDVHAEQAFDFLADGMNQRFWALFSIERRQLGPDTFVGSSMFDAVDEYVRLRPNRELLLVDYFIGFEGPDNLRHQVQSRVIPGPELGRPENTCVVTNVVWRDEAYTPEVWGLIYHVWKVELALIKGKLEQLHPASA